MTVARCSVLALLLCAMTASQAGAECGPHPPICSLLRYAPIIFVGTLESYDAQTFHFRVEERFRGVRASTVDVLSTVYEGSSGYAGTGERYVVFADRFKLDDETLTVFKSCARNMTLIKYAQPVLQQLRRERDGQRMSTVYGSLLTDPYDHYADSGRLLPGIALTFKSDSRTFNVTTDAQGTYAIDRVPAGTYHVFADLPPELELGQFILHEPPPPIEIEPNACLEQDIVAVPNGRISGIVFGPDGVPRKTTTVRLFKADQYVEASAAPYALQGNGGPFTFSRLQPGDYLLAFDTNADADGENPFPTTFYPNVANAKEATVIHLGPGQQVLNADIYLPEPIATRPVRFVVVWNGRSRSQYYSPVIRPATGHFSTTPKRVAEDVYEIDLLTNRTYRIQAFASCRSTNGVLRTEDVTVEGANPLQEEVTLTLTGDECTRK